MIVRILLLAFLVTNGCGSAIDTIVPERLPTPIGDVFLPVYPSDVPYSIRINVRALISDDGTVRAAQISPRTGDDLWDSLAVLAIRGWRFSPALQNGRPVPAWVRFPVTLRFAEAHPIPLAEIIVATRSLADSIYALLSDGRDFGSLAMRYSLGPTAQDSGYLGPRPLKDFPLPVQMAITSVGLGQATHPIMIEGRYVIYKRLRREENS
ncbi:MAG: TonB family protein [Bacteroidetes bacterium]|jgi:TonB family protein|nr:TonB family protein [Bacteroidota bacterium]